jgi:hypothetical protein
LVVVVGLIAVAPSWYVSGHIGFERGYGPDVARIDLQARIGAHRDCLSSVKTDPHALPASPDDQFSRLGWEMGATERCNRMAGFAYFNKAELEQTYP